MWLRRDRIRRALVLFCALSGVVGCSEEPGRIRADASQLIGSYQIALVNGVERLELKSNGTYIQELTWKSRPTQHTGKWHIQNHMFDGSDVVLTDALLSEDDAKDPLRYGELILNVHDRSGNIALARNEVEDRYFERLH